MERLSQLLFYVPGILASIAGLVAAGWIYPQRRAVAWLLGSGVGVQIVASAISAGVSAWFMLSLESEDFPHSSFALISAVFGATSSILHAVGFLLLIAATVAAVTGWGEGAAPDGAAPSGSEPPEAE